MGGRGEGRRKEEKERRGSRRRVVSRVEGR